MLLNRRIFLSRVHVTSMVVPRSPIDNSNIPWYRKGWGMRMAASALGTGVGSSRASGLPWCSSFGPCFQGPAPRGFTIIPDFDFGVNASREGLIETIAQSSRQSVIWNEKVMSEHVFIHAPKRLTNEPRFDQHQCQNFGTKKVPG